MTQRRIRRKLRRRTQGRIRRTIRKRTRMRTGRRIRKRTCRGLGEKSYERPGGHRALRAGRLRGDSVRRAPSCCAWPWSLADAVKWFIDEKLAMRLAAMSGHGDVRPIERSGVYRAMFRARIPASGLWWSFSRWGPWLRVCFPSPSAPPFEYNYAHAQVVPDLAVGKRCARMCPHICF